MHLRFNSKLVRLKVWNPLKKPRTLKRFQFQTGAIKSWVPSRYASHMDSFNSKLVRLKASAGFSVTGAGVSFQFQTGAIKRFEVYPGVGFGAGFQFQTGAIKSSVAITALTEITGFNSKLVRLKGRPSKSPQSHCWWFQFQTGAIKRYIPDGGSPCRHGFNSKLVRLKVWIQSASSDFQKCFNSKLVRLKDANLRRVWCCLSYVSIPNWCD